jgi:ATP-dependent protease HslVU (ClpYQ) peptidase subunit
MTCIVGIADGNEVWMGGDSAAANGYETRVTTLPKVFIVNTTARERFLLGYTSSFRMGQLLQYRLDITTPRSDGTSPLRYLVTTFAEAVRDLFRGAGYARVESNQENGGVFLVGYAGGIFRVGSDYQVNQMADGFDVAGCGEEYALGALASTGAMAPEERIKNALVVAARFSGEVSAPFVIEHLG